MTRAAIYARYSSDLPRDASIEDQVRLCRAHAEREGWDGRRRLRRPGDQRRLGDAAGLPARCWRRCSPAASTSCSPRRSTG